jgi:hypothetical protein
MRSMMIFMGFVPYAILAAYDGWLHGHARAVPRTEQILHAALALSLGIFLSLVAAANTVAALAVFAVFVVLLLFDEFGFHGDIEKHEQRVHWLADTALLGFVLYWLWFDGVIYG